LERSRFIQNKSAMIQPKNPHCSARFACVAPAAPFFHWHASVCTLVTNPSCLPTFLCQRSRSQSPTVDVCIAAFARYLPRDLRLAAHHACPRLDSLPGPRRTLQHGEYSTSHSRMPSRYRGFSVPDTGDVDHPNSRPRPRRHDPIR
jgi:hypothetical protein